MTRSTKLWTLAYKLIGAAIVLVVFAALALVSFNNAQLRAEHREIFAAYQASVDNAERLYEQLLELGEDPQGERPSTVAPSTTIQGEPGARGPTGAPGRAPTDAEVAAAVAKYCAQNACVGATGATGPAGTDGESITGPQGPQGPPGESIVGPQGPPGPTGPTCPDGYYVSYVWLSIAESQFGVFSRQPAAICRPT